MSTYIYAFLFCGLVCMISQLILDNTKLTPGHVTSLFVVLGAMLDVFGIYDKIVLYCGAGAIIPSVYRPASPRKLTPLRTFFRVSYRRRKILSRSFAQFGIVFCFL